MRWLRWQQPRSLSSCSAPCRPRKARRRSVADRGRLSNRPRQSRSTSSSSWNCETTGSSRPRSRGKHEGEEDTALFSGARRSPPMRFALVPLRGGLPRTRSRKNSDDDRPGRDRAELRLLRRVISNGAQPSLCRPFCVVVALGYGMTSLSDGFDGSLLAHQFPASPLRLTL